MFFAFVLLFKFISFSETLLPTLRIGFCCFNGDDDTNPPPGPAVMAITKASFESADPIVPLPGKAAFNVAWHMEYTNTSSGAVKGAIRRMIGNRYPGVKHGPVHVLVGCGSSGNSMKVAPVSAFFGVPLVSWLSGSPKLSSKVDYPFFLRTRGTSTGNGAGVVTVAHHFGWTRIGFIYQEQSFHVGAYNGATDKALSFGMLLDGFVLYNFPDEVNHPVWALTMADAAASKSRVFGLAVVGAHSDDALEIGRTLSLNSRLFIMAMELVDFYPYFPEDLKADWIGMLGIDYSQTGGNAQADRFQKAWYDMTFDKMRDAEFIPEDWTANIEQLVPDVFTRNPFIQFQAYLFDAIMAVIIAYQSMLDNGLPGQDFAYGAAYLDALYNTTFAGVSGDVSFTPRVKGAGGDREVSTFDLFNAIRGQGVEDGCCSVLRIGAVGLAAVIMQIPFFPDGKSDARIYDAQVCDTGSGWQEESSTCIRCRPGTKSEEMASGNRELTCTTCEQGRFSNSQASTACEVCAPGRYNERAGSTQCYNCNTGSHCFGGLEPPISQAGYYLVSYALADECTVGVEEFVNGRVEVTSVCLGNKSYMSQELSCMVGHTGPLCGACAHSYSREEMISRCKECGIKTDTDAVWEMLVVAFDSMWTAAFTTMIGYIVLMDLNDRSNVGPVLVRVLKHWVAVCGVLGSMDFSTIKPFADTPDTDDDSSVYPLWVTDFVQIVFFFSSRIFPKIVKPQFRLQCLADYFNASLSARINLVFTWWLLNPIFSALWITLFVFLLDKLVFPLLRRKTHKASEESILVSHHVHRTFFALLVYLTWDELASRALAGLMCVELGSGEHVWLGNPSQSCGDVARILIVSSILLVWFFGFTVVLLFVVHRRMKSQRTNKVLHKETIRLYGFFFRGLEQNFWWWEICVKRFDMLCVLLITYSSLIKDNRSKLVLYTMQAGAAWGIHNIAVPYLKLQCQLIDVIEGHALFTRFVSFGSLVLPSILSGAFVGPSLILIVLALCADVAFMGEIFFHIAWIQSYKVAVKLTAIERALSTSRFRSSCFAKLVQKLEAALSFIHREHELLTESALHIQWFGPGLTLNMSDGKMPYVNGSIFRNTCRKVLWRAFHMGNEKQAEHCLHGIHGITRVLIDAGHHMPPELIEVICILALALKQAHESEHIDALIESANFFTQEQLQAYIDLKDSNEGPQKNVRANKHLWHVSGEDLQRLLFLLNNLTLDEVSRIAEHVANNLEAHADREPEGAVKDCETNTATYVREAAALLASKDNKIQELQEQIQRLQENSAGRQVNKQVAASGEVVEQGRPGSVELHQIEFATQDAHGELKASLDWYTHHWMKKYR